MNEGNPRTSHHATRHGFNLFELVMVLAIMGIMAAIAAPRFGQASARYRADVAARRICKDLGLASRAARNAGASRTFKFERSGGAYTGAYTISSLAGLVKSSDTYRVDLSADPYRSQVDSVNFGGSRKVMFNGYGQAGSSGTIVLKSGDLTRTVTFDATSGKASIQ